MIELLDQTSTLMLSFVVGVAVGTCYWLGLRVTVRKLMLQQIGWYWLPLSVLLRLAFALSVFYLTLRIGSWMHLIATLVGFLAARWPFTHSASQQQSGRISTSEVPR